MPPAKIKMFFFSDAAFCLVQGCYFGTGPAQENPMGPKNMYAFVVVVVFLREKDGFHPAQILVRHGFF